MSLVQYSSSDESDTEEQQPTVTRTENVSANSISMFLPEPKNKAVIPSKGRIFGGGFGNMPHDVENVELSRGRATVTSFVPHSLRKKNTSKPLNMIRSTDLPKIELFQQVKAKARTHITNDKIQIQPVIYDGDEPILAQVESQAQAQTQPNKRPLEEEPVIKEFNVVEFYDKNAELKAQGLLEENKRLHTVTNHKNQLSALMKNAQQDEELLKDKFERNKKARKERGEKYGW